MSNTRLRIVLAVFWLGLGVCLLLRDTLFPAEVFAKYDGVRLSLAGWLAVALAAWNGLRVYRAFSIDRNPPSNPLRHEQATKQVDEYNPEFDFTRPADQETGGNPSTSTS